MHGSVEAWLPRPLHHLTGRMRAGPQTVRVHGDEAGGDPGLVVPRDALRTELFLWEKSKLGGGTF